MATPTKDLQGVRSNASQKLKNQENSNPNLTSPSLKSPSAKSTRKSASKNPNPSFASPKKRIKERKFVVAKKNHVKKQDSIRNCKCKDKVNGKCLCVAYDNLRASQEEFFKSRGVEEIQQIPINHNHHHDDGGCKPEEAESPKGTGLGLGLGLGSSTIKRRRDIVLEEARQSVPEAGSGRVLYLVKAFERLLTVPKESESEFINKKDDNHIQDTEKGLKWALPGLQHHPPRAPETHESTTEFCPGELFFNAQSLGLGAHFSSSLDSSRGSVSSRNSVGSRRSQRSGSFSSETVGGRNCRKKQQHTVTSLRPFRLRTEQRGKMKEEEFVKKLQELMLEEEKQRIPIAQGLPWTTDEPECLMKPPIKEITKPVDLKLHSDVRAVERADFDHQVAEKLMLIEQYKMERERQQKLEEEEEIRRLRKEDLVPKAQPMPYFDRPFVPRRSTKQPTVPKEPKFQFPQQKKIKCSLSWDDFNDCIHAT